MNVTVSNKNGVIWMRDTKALEGITSIAFLRDGTQQKIIAALEEALFQAKAQISLSEDIN